MAITSCRQRPYFVEHTRSHPNSEVKRRKARSVLGWGTAREALRVLLAFLKFYFLLANKYVTRIELLKVQTCNGYTIILVYPCGKMLSVVDEVRPLAFANGHTSSNIPDPIRTRKSSDERPGQYWGGGPPGKPLGCCWHF